MQTSYTSTPTRDGETDNTRVEKKKREINKRERDLEKEKWGKGSNVSEMGRERRSWTDQDLSVREKSGERLTMEEGETARNVEGGW